MPRVPFQYQPYPEVSPTTEGTPSVHVDTPVAAFGGATAQATSALGRTLEHSADTLFNTALSMQKDQLEANVNEAVTQNLVSTGELDNKFRLLQGKDPQEQLEGHKNTLVSSRESIRNGLKTDYERKLFDRETMRRLGYDIVNASNYSAQQFKQYTNQSYEANQLSMVDRVAKDPYNEQYVNDVIQSTIDSESKASAALGDPPELTQMKIKAKLGRVVDGLTNSLAKENPDRAMQILEKFYKEDKVSATQYQETKAKITDKGIQYHSAMDARTLAGGPVPPNHPAAQAAPIIAQIAEIKGWDKPGSTFTTENIYRLVQQESGGKNMPPNQYGYAGYFQMKPKEFGLTPADFAKMSFEQQLDLYANSYLKKYGYDGTQDLGVMNAAPAFGKSSDLKIAYPAGSPEAMANPSWVKYSQAGGAVTVGGIKAWAAAGGQGSVTIPEVTLPEIMQRGAELAKKHFPDNVAAQERYLEQLGSHAQRNSTLMRSQITQTIRANRTAIDSVLFNPGAGDRGPTSLEEANRIDPNFGQKWEDAARLNPTITKHINDTFNYNAKQDVPMNQERFDRWQAAKGMRVTDPDQFKTLSLASLDLPRAQYNELHTMQLADAKKTQDTSKINGYLRAVQPMINDAGIYANNPGKYNQFVGAFQARIEEMAGQKGGKMPTVAEAQGIAASLIRDRGGFMGFGTTQDFEVPSSFITDELKDKFAKKYGHEPTPAEIFRLYQLSKTQ